jgi:GH15 family glucan-1,4-alpha-glucosidase
VDCRLANVQYGCIEDEYLPIEQHGLIGDLHTAALVGIDGTIDWYCAPTFDSASVFASILDSQRGGYYKIYPHCEGWSSKQLYFPDTNVLITRFLTPDGVGELQDFMPLKSPGVPHRQRLIRRVVCVRGDMRFVVEVQPRFDYGRATHTLDLQSPGAKFSIPDFCLTLESPVPLQPDDTGCSAQFSLSAPDSAAFVLETGRPEDDNPGPHSEQRVNELFDATVTYWRRWLSRSSYRGRWREMIDRSALTLKLLTYEPTGAIVAAPTTSLPEKVGGSRNWDYRYMWVRDAAFSLFALLKLGFTDEAHAFISFLSERLFRHDLSESGPLGVVYSVDGRLELVEQELGHLSGYRDSAPVRIGNDASNQLQLDVYGELIDSLYISNKYAAPIPHDVWMEISKIVEWVCRNWDRPDEGIWETRGGRQKFTYSRVMAWVAVERALRIGSQRGLPHNASHWSRMRDAIYTQVMASGFDDARQAFVQHYETNVLDASVLLMPLVKFISPIDPRWLSTMDAIEDELVSDSLVYRYNPEASPDGFAEDEGTFSMCTFWFVEALTRAGRLDQARLVFEKMLTYANHLGLYSEQIGPTGELLGNFPQAFTHLALVSAAINLDSALG